jgi:hypothetical protein
MTTLTWEDRHDLAKRFAPYLVLFPENKRLARPGKEVDQIGDYHPRSLQLLLADGRLYPGTLRALFSLKLAWLFDHKSRPIATPDRLAAHKYDDYYQIRLLGPAVPQPDHAWRRYFELLDPERYPHTIYAHVQTRTEAVAAAEREVKDYDQHRAQIGQPFYSDRSQADDDVCIQYWFCYYFDDWANVHEGDWEGISIFLQRDDSSQCKYRPIGATYYEHEGGSRRHWENVLLVNGDHPLVFVAAGSHASYFAYQPKGYAAPVQSPILPFIHLKMQFKFYSERQDRVAALPSNIRLNGNKVEIPADYAPAENDPSIVVPNSQSPLGVEVLPDDNQPIGANEPEREHLKWLIFPGAWGARELGRFIVGAPTGPSQKGLKWHDPFAWSESECWPDYSIY